MEAIVFILIIVLLIARVRRSARLEMIENRLGALETSVKSITEAFAGAAATPSTLLQSRAEAGQEKAPAQLAPGAKEVESPAVHAKNSSVPPVRSAAFLKAAAASAEKTSAERAAPPQVTAEREPSPDALTDFFGRLHDEIFSSFNRERLAATDWEALFGGRVLDKVGIIVLVIGITLLLGYTLQYYSPLGRVLTGVAASLTLAACGVWLERTERYRLLSKPLIGGGWALLYFTTYAAYHIEPAKILDHPTLSLLLLALVAIGMIAHSFKYRSEVLTGLAYGLAFLAVAISPASLFGLIACALLAASLIAVLRYMPSHHLGVVAVIGTYVNHYLWLGAEMAKAEPLVSPDAVWMSVGILGLYWLLFAVLILVRKPATDTEDYTSLAVQGGSTIGFLTLACWQVWITVPETIAIVTGTAAIAHVALSYMLRLAHRTLLHLVNACIAAALAAATFPLAQNAWQFSDAWLALCWGAEAALLLALGLKLREVVLRIASYVLCAVSFLALISINLLGVVESEPTLVWITAPPVILFFYFVFETLQRVADRRDVLAPARPLGMVFGFAATGLLAGLIWQELPHSWVGLIWLMLGAGAFEFGLRVHRLPVRGQGYVLLAAGVAALVSVNIYGVVDVGADPLSRWLAVLPAVPVLAFVFWRLRMQASLPAFDTTEVELRDLPSYAATSILAVLLWKELDAVSLALVWAFLGLALFESGSRLRIGALMYQGIILSGLAFVRLFMANFTADGETFGLSHRLITVVPIAALFYYLRLRVREEPVRAFIPRAEAYLSDAYSYGAAILLVVLARFELDRALTVIGWAPLMMAFFVLGTLLKANDFRIQAYILAAAIFLRSWVTNFYLEGDFYGFPERLFSAFIVITAYLVLSIFCVWKRDTLADLATRGPKLLSNIDTYAHAIFGLCSTILTAALLYYEVDRNLLTMAWAIEAVVVLAMGFVVSERVFRLFGLGLLFVCVLKLVLIDLADMEALFRIISFIFLGIILILISFVYTRYREVISRYL